VTCFPDVKNKERKIPDNLIKKKKLVDEKIQDIIDEEKLYLER